MVVLLGLGSAVLVGCRSRQPIDPGKYFSKTDPLQTIVAFSLGVAAARWEHVSDCLRSEQAPLPRAALQELGELEVGTNRARADVSFSPDGTEAVVVAPFKEDLQPPNRPAQFKVYLEALETVEGVRLWRIDGARTLRENSRAIAAPGPEDGGE